MHPLDPWSHPEFSEFALDEADATAFIGISWQPLNGDVTFVPFASIYVPTQYCIYGRKETLGRNRQRILEDSIKRCLDNQLVVLDQVGTDSVDGRGGIGIDVAAAVVSPEA